MKKYFFLILCLSALCDTYAQLQKGQIKINGMERNFLYALPSKVNQEQKIPLVLAFHGGGGQPKHMAELSKFHELVEKEPLMVVYPEGYKKNWNDGRIAPKNHAFREGIDDVAFISQLIDRLVKDFPVDSKRIFATGMSNGGHLAIYLSLKLSDKILAVAPVCASIPINLEKEFATLPKPISVMIINGTKDKLVKYEGGEVLSAKRGEVIGTEEMVKIYVSQNTCQATPQTKEFPNVDKKDGCTATQFTYTNGKNDTEVILIKIEGGGHAWAGGIQYFPKLFVGNLCRDFDATEQIWRFFKSTQTRK
jgi:polyhydroxybutyrate depolymerase